MRGTNTDGPWGSHIAVFCIRILVTFRQFTSPVSLLAIRRLPGEHLSGANYSLGDAFLLKRLKRLKLFPRS